MGFFSKEFSDVVEWNESKEGVIFWKWKNGEIKKGSKLVVRPGQDAIFMFNGRVEGIFEDEGSFDVESEIIPFLSTLKGFKFGFNSGMRAEVLFINTREFLVKWGTKNAINLPAPGLPGGMPIRAFGTYSCKIAERGTVIDKLAGIQDIYSIEDVRARITTNLDPLLMSWIGKAGRDMFNLQMDAIQIAKGIETDLDMDMRKIGIAITDFNIESFSYPEEIRKLQEKAAAQSMVGDMGKYQQMAVADGMGKGNGGGHNIAGDMVSMQMGMAMGQQMVQQMNTPGAVPQNPVPTQSQGETSANTSIPKFCPECGSATNGAKFCSNCGYKLVQ